MAEKDAMEKTLESYNDVFADIVNVLLFDGERLVREDDLADESPISVYKADGRIHEQERDVAKFWKGCHVQIALLGLENQTRPDADMPLRVIGYDGAAYRRQLLERGRADRESETGKDLGNQDLGNENLGSGAHAGNPKSHDAPKSDAKKPPRYPVVTLILYFGKTHWNRPLSLTDRLEIPDRLQPYVSDYKINLFEIAWLSDEQVRMFQSDFRIVVDYFVQTRKNAAYVPSADVIRHVDAVLKLMSALTEDSRFEEVVNSSEEKETGKGGPKNMCEVIDNFVAQGRAQGELLGETQEALRSIRSLMRTQHCPADRAMNMLEISPANREKYMAMLQSQTAEA